MAEHAGEAQPTGDGSVLDRPGRPPDFSLRPILIPAFAPAVLFGIAEGAVLPVVALTARQLGGSLALASLIVALIGIGSLVSNIPSALITTRYGERTAIIIAGTVSAAALLLAMFAPDNLVLGLAMLLVGFANAVFSLARMSYLTEVVPVHLRARALSTLGGSARVGIFAGPFIGAAAIQLAGTRAAYAVGAAAAATAGLVAVFARDLILTGDGPEHSSVSVGMVLRSHRRVFLTLGIGVILVAAVRASRQVVLPLWSEHLGLSPAATSVIYGLAGAVDMATFYPAGRVMDRRGRRWVAVPSMLTMGCALVLVPLTAGFGTLLLAALLLGFGNGIGSGMIMTLGADHAPAVGRPSFLGIWRLLSDTGSCGGPVLLSALAGTVGLAAAVVGNGLLGLLAAGVLWHWIPVRGRRRPPATEA
ncbi:MAG TPA: MFS transporter [Jatrophihabitans sp.]|nr:MFS transporter [Jatrophihabitans sp.]